MSLLKLYQLLLILPGKDYALVIIQLEDNKSDGKKIIVNIKKSLGEVPIILLCSEALVEQEIDPFWSKNIQHTLSDPIRQSALYGAICDVLNVEDPIPISAAYRLYWFQHTNISEESVYIGR